MDFSLNWVEILIETAIVWSAIKTEVALRRWRARRNEIPMPVRKVPVKLKSITKGADKTQDNQCGHNTRDFAIYTDGTTKCLVCLKEEG